MATAGVVALSRWTLCSYYRSSASYRVRIALALKGIECDLRYIHLLENDGEQHAEEYRQLNPSELVPTLISSDGALAQSLAIIEYLNEVHPDYALLPGSPWQRAGIRAFCQALSSDCQPLINLRVQQYLQQSGFSGIELKAWLKHWLTGGLGVAEQTLAHYHSQQLRDPNEGRCCFSSKPSMADTVLIPQLYSAERFGVEINQYPRLFKVYTYCNTLEAFVSASPQAQGDAPLH